ncbi:MAG TPA: sigma 54-interacting transcriptional regulator [Chitinophagaceae bacterium]|nr:sigma 54-interacting transcriptional regulator [Chitinophagaceae bacterium]
MKPRRQQVHTEVLLSLGRDVMRIGNRKDAAEFISKVLKQYIAFDGSLVARYGNSTRTFSPFISATQEQFQAVETQLPIEYFVHAHSLHEHAPMIWNIDSLKPESVYEMASLSKSGVKKLVTLPLVERDEFVYFFVLFSKVEQSFTNYEVELLKGICRPISVAVINIIANEEIAKREEEKNLLLSLSTEVAAIRNREHFFKVLNRRINELFAVSEFGIAQIDEGRKTYSAFSLEFKESTRSNAAFSPVTSAKYDVNDPIFTKIMASAEPVLFNVNEVAQAPGMPAYVKFWAMAGFRYYLALPLRVGGRDIGFINLHLENPEVFNTKSVLLKGVCDQLAVAISNILANEEIQKREQEQTTLLSLSNEIATVKTREDLFKIVNSKVKALFHIEQFLLAKIDDDGKSCMAFVLDVKPESAEKADGQKIATSPFDATDPVFSMIFTSADPVILEVDGLSHLVTTPAYVAFWKQLGIKKMLFSALKVGGLAIGVAGFPIDNIPDFDVRNALLKSICAQLAVAMSNILANEKVLAREEETNLLLSLSNEIAALNSRADLFKVVTAKVKQLFGIKELGFSTIDENRETYSIFLVDVGEKITSHPHFNDLLTAQFSVHDPLFTAVMKLDEPAHYQVDDLINLPGMPAYVAFWKETGIERVVTLPLRVGGNGIGTALFILEKNQEFNIKSTLLKGVCSQLAVTISNILSNERIRERELEKTKLLAFSNAIASVTDTQVLAKRLKNQLRNLFGIEDYIIHALSTDKKTHRPILYDADADFARHPDFQKLLNIDTDVNDGVFNIILNSDDIVLFNVEEWFNVPQPPIYSNAARHIGLKKMGGVAIRLGEENIGVMNFRKDGANQFTFQDSIFRSICSQIAIAVSNIIANEKINRQLIEIGNYKQQLEEEKIYLKEEIETNQNYSEIIGESSEIKKVFRLVTQVAHSDSTVLLLGETGTGKELIARAIHNASPRKDKLMIKINCAALPPNLIESELFGHERGSFTGALERRIGKFELANRGTLFLDEIGEMPLELQVKLLRALQEKEIERIGGKTTIKTDVRIIAATNRDLEKMMEEGKFRSDLYYRLNIFPIYLPPLRDRKEDIPQLALHFLRRYSKKTGKRITTLSSKGLQLLKNYDWPGNIRELEHLIERSVLLSETDTIKDIHLPIQKPRSSSPIEPDAFKAQTIFEVEKEYIMKVLKHVHGKISGEGGAADLLGIPPSTLHSRMKKLGIRRLHQAG